MFNKTNLIEKYNENLDTNVNQTFNDKKSNILKTTLLSLAIATNVYGMTPKEDDPFIKNKQSIEKHNEQLNTNVNQHYLELHYKNKVYYDDEAQKLSNQLNEDSKPNEYITKLREIRHEIVQPLRDVRDGIFSSISDVNQEKNKLIDDIQNSDFYKNMKANRMSTNDYLKEITNSNIELYDINKDLVRTSTILYKKLNDINKSIDTSNYFTKHANFKDDDIEKISIKEIEKANMLISEANIFQNIFDYKPKSNELNKEKNELQLSMKSFFENYDSFSKKEQTYLILKFHESFYNLKSVDEFNNDYKQYHNFSMDQMLYTNQNNKAESIYNFIESIRTVYKAPENTNDQRIINNEEQELDINSEREIS